MTEFKIGDWIKHKVYIEAPMQINEVYKTAVHIKYNGIYDNTEVELWQPKPNEWCWFWNVTDFDAPTLSRFCGMQDKLFRCTNSKQNLFTHCEPFIGQLPTSLKDQS